MVYKAKKGQVSYGEAVGIILLDQQSCPFIPGDVANATSYRYPVRFQRVEGFTVERIMRHDLTLQERVLAAGKALVREGVRAITGDCGFMVIYQEKLTETLGVPAFMSSLLQIPFIGRIIGKSRKIGIVTANARSLDESVLKKAGAEDLGGLVIKGLENTEHFGPVALHETTDVLDSEKVEAEVVGAAVEIAKRDPSVGAILLECSLLPPYGAAVQEAVNLPVFDFLTMIDYVHSAVVKRRFEGHL